jgi:hypothetical protein
MTAPDAILLLNLTAENLGVLTLTRPALGAWPAAP